MVWISAGRYDAARGWLDAWNRLTESMVVCFFFQAEDGIRDLIVTGVQTCALPISPGGVTRGPGSGDGVLAVPVGGPAGSAAIGPGPPCGRAVRVPGAGAPGIGVARVGAPGVGLAGGRPGGTCRGWWLCKWVAGCRAPRTPAPAPARLQRGNRPPRSPIAPRACCTTTTRRMLPRRLPPRAAGPPKVRDT